MHRSRQKPRPSRPRVESTAFKRRLPATIRESNSIDIPQSSRRRLAFVAVAPMADNRLKPNHVALLNSSLTTRPITNTIHFSRSSTPSVPPSICDQNQSLSSTIDQPTIISSRSSNSIQSVIPHSLNPSQPHSPLLSDHQTEHCSSINRSQLPPLLSTRGSNRLGVGSLQHTNQPFRSFHSPHRPHRRFYGYNNRDRGDDDHDYYQNEEGQTFIEAEIVTDEPPQIHKSSTSVSQNSPKSRSPGHFDRSSDNYQHDFDHDDLDPLYHDDTNSMKSKKKKNKKNQDAMFDDQFESFPPNGDEDLSILDSLGQYPSVDETYASFDDGVEFGDGKRSEKKAKKDKSKKDKSKKKKSSKLPHELEEEELLEALGIGPSSSSARPAPPPPPSDDEDPDNLLDNMYRDNNSDDDEDKGQRKQKRNNKNDRNETEKSEQAKANDKARMAQSRRQVRSDLPLLNKLHQYVHLSSGAAEIDDFIFISQRAREEPNSQEAAFVSLYQLFLTSISPKMDHPPHYLVTKTATTQNHDKNGQNNKNEQINQNDDPRPPQLTDLPPVDKLGLSQEGIGQISKARIVELDYEIETTTTALKHLLVHRFLHNFSISKTGHRAQTYMDLPFRKPQYRFLEHYTDEDLLYIAEQPYSWENDDGSLLGDFEGLQSNIFGPNSSGKLDLNEINMADIPVLMDHLDWVLADKPEQIGGLDQLMRIDDDFDSSHSQFSQFANHDHDHNHNQNDITATNTNTNTDPNRSKPKHKKTNSSIIDRIIRHEQVGKNPALTQLLPFTPYKTLFHAFLTHYLTSPYHSLETNEAWIENIGQWQRFLLLHGGQIRLAQHFNGGQFDDWYSSAVLPTIADFFWPDGDKDGNGNRVATTGALVQKAGHLVGGGRGNDNSNGDGGKKGTNSLVDFSTLAATTELDLFPSRSDWFRATDENYMITMRTIEKMARNQTEIKSTHNVIKMIATILNLEQFRSHFSGFVIPNRDELDEAARAEKEEQEQALAVGATDPLNASGLKATTSSASLPRRKIPTILDPFPHKTHIDYNHVIARFMHEVEHSLHTLSSLQKSILDTELPSFTTIPSLQLERIEQIEKTRAEQDLVYEKRKKEFTAKTALEKYLNFVNKPGQTNPRELHKIAMERATLPKTQEETDPDYRLKKGETYVLTNPKDGTIWEKYPYRPSNWHDLTDPPQPAAPNWTGESGSGTGAGGVSMTQKPHLGVLAQSPNFIPTSLAFTLRPVGNRGRFMSHGPNAYGRNDLQKLMRAVSAYRTGSLIYPPRPVEGRIGGKRVGGGSGSGSGGSGTDQGQAQAPVPNPLFLHRFKRYRTWDEVSREQEIRRGTVEAHQVTDGTWVVDLEANEFPTTSSTNNTNTNKETSSMTNLSQNPLSFPMSASSSPFNPMNNSTSRHSSAPSVPSQSRSLPSSQQEQQPSWKQGFQTPSNYQYGQKSPQSSSLSRPNQRHHQNQNQGQNQQKHFQSQTTPSPQTSPSSSSSPLISSPSILPPFVPKLPLAQIQSLDPLFPHNLVQRERDLTSTIRSLNNSFTMALYHRLDYFKQFIIAAQPLWHIATDDTYHQVRRQLGQVVHQTFPKDSSPLVDKITITSPTDPTQNPNPSDPSTSTPSDIVINEDPSFRKILKMTIETGFPEPPVIDLSQLGLTPVNMTRLILGDQSAYGIVGDFVVERTISNQGQSQAQRKSEMGLSGTDFDFSVDSLRSASYSLQYHNSIQSRFIDVKVRMPVPSDVYDVTVARNLTERLKLDQVRLQRTGTIDSLGRWNKPSLLSKFPTEDIGSSALIDANKNTDVDMNDASKLKFPTLHPYTILSSLNLSQRELFEQWAQSYSFNKSDIPSNYFERRELELEKKHQYVRKLFIRYLYNKIMPSPFQIDPAVPLDANQLMYRFGMNGQDEDKEEEDPEVVAARLEAKRKADRQRMLDKYLNKDSDDGTPKAPAKRKVPEIMPKTYQVNHLGELLPSFGLHAIDVPEPPKLVKARVKHDYEWSKWDELRAYRPTRIEIWFKRMKAAWTDLISDSFLEAANIMRYLTDIRQGDNLVNFLAERNFKISKDTEYAAPSVTALLRNFVTLPTTNGGPSNFRSLVGADAGVGVGVGVGIETSFNQEQIDRKQFEAFKKHIAQWRRLDFERPPSRPDQRPAPSPATSPPEAPTPSSNEPQFTGTWIPANQDGPIEMGSGPIQMGDGPIIMGEAPIQMSGGASPPPPQNDGGAILL